MSNPVQSALHSALRPVGDFIYGAVEYRSLEAQNQQLRRQLASAQSAPIAAAAEQQEAEQVLAQAHLPYVASIPTVVAQVVDLGSANFEQSIEIDRGSTNGVAVNQPVVSAGGLVGTVSSVSPHLATVVLINDPTLTVGVRDVRNGVVGAAVGEGSGNSLQVENVNVGQGVKRGDSIVTSGLSLEHFPAGIPVGTIKSVAAPSGALQLEVAVKPAADLVNLQFVRVLLWSPQGG